ncbi:cytochrome P450 [Daedaleopsis nitida]|nr:cytochrome P450 [Daedaleopsis nitida]
MSTSLNTALMAIALLVLALLRRVTQRRSVKNIQGPASPSLLFGHELALSHQADVGSLEFDWMRKYGATWRISGCFGTDILMTADPKASCASYAMQHIYQKTAYGYLKRASQNHFAYIIAGPGIVSATAAEDHNRHRKIMNPAFGPAHLRSFLPLFQRIGAKVTEKWKSDLAASDDTEVMMNRWLSRATLDIVGQAAFDYDYGAVEDGEGSALYKAYDKIFIGSYSKQVDYKPPKSVILFQATWDYIPESILKLFSHIPTAPFTTLRDINGQFMQYGRQILQEKRAEIEADKESSGKDIMSLLIKANTSADPKTRMSDEEMKAQMFTLTLAGHETTAATLTFLFYELTRHPEYQTRMRQEISDVRARVRARGDNDFSMEDLDSMTLCMNAIKETLRFHSVIPNLPRVASQDEVLPLAQPIVSTTGETISEIPISAGQVIMTSFAAYHRLTDVWGADADIWNPERFTRPEVGKQTNVGMFSNLMTFSAGVRGCLGWRFSVIEMQALLAELVENFNFAPPADKVEIDRAIAGLVMVPIVHGKEEMGKIMPIRVSLAQ